MNTTSLTLLSRTRTEVYKRPGQTHLSPQSSIQPQYQYQYQYRKHHHTTSPLQPSHQTRPSKTGLQHKHWRRARFGYSDCSGSIERLTVRKFEGSSDTAGSGEGLCGLILKVVMSGIGGGRVCWEDNTTTSFHVRNIKYKGFS